VSLKVPSQNYNYTLLVICESTASLPGTILPFTVYLHYTMW